MEGARPQRRVFLALKCEQEDIVMVSTFLPHPAVIFPVWAQSVKNLPAMQETWVQLGRSPGEGNGNPLQYSCLGNPLNRGAWQATVHGVAKESRHTERLNHTTTHSK